MKSIVIRLSFGMILLLLSISALRAASMPDGSISIEAEEYFLKDINFEVENCIFSSHGKHVQGKVNSKFDKPALLFQAEFPENGKAYTVWARSRELSLIINSSLLPMKEFKTFSSDWNWHNLGRYDSKQIGSSFSIFAAPDKRGTAAKRGLDCVMLVPTPGYTPTGVYYGAVGPEDEKAKTENANNSGPIETAVTIYTDRKGSNVSEFIASANTHGAQAHCIDTPEWNDTMKAFFSDNLVVLLHGAYKKPNDKGEWWDFKAFDTYVINAKQKWKVKDVMFLPQWWLKWADKNGDPTEAEMESGRKLLMQLVERYGKPGPLYIKYWVICDEWPCGGYWRKNYKKFAKYYASLVRSIKKFNPELKVGGPVDCWPNDTIIAELLQQCPELDFIAWNIFIVGRADAPLPHVFRRSSYLKLNVKSSRELAQKILKKDLPIMVSSYGSNYRAWNPPDYNQARPITGVWNALALNYLTEANCFSGVYYNVRARDCGLFGPQDPYALKGNMIPAKMNPDSVNIRPSGRIHYFFKKNVAGSTLNELKISGDSENFSIIATESADKSENIVMVNFAEKARTVTITLEPFAMPEYAGFNLPTEYIYCDRYSIRNGKGFFFCNKGKAKIYMPSFSAFCLKTQCRDKAAKYENVSALFPCDGNYYDVAGSGSHSLGWYGNHFSDKIFKTGTGSIDCNGLHKRGRIRLSGAADINGKQQFGIAFWVYREKNTADFGSILSFGSGKFEIEHVGGGNPDDYFQATNPGFCTFGGTWKHYIKIPAKQWTHIAITADGKTGRIIIDGQEKYAAKQTGKGLNGSNILYLGSEQHDTGPIECYIDELVISGKAAGADWAKEIYEATKNGNKYTPPTRQ